MTETQDYIVFTLHNFDQIPQVNKYLNAEQYRAIEVVGTVLPFKVNNYVIDELINWDNVPNDPIFILTFPQKEMLKEEHYHLVDQALKNEIPQIELKKIVNSIRAELNPNPAGQQDHNVPILDGQRLHGVQHKYDQTLLFFPSHGQTCHAYCTFCFRWPQFIGDKNLKFAQNETSNVIEYLKRHPKITDVLFTGGDPMTMSASRLRAYLEPFLSPELDHVQTIRIGTKSISYWPYRYINDKDTEELLDLFRQITEAGKHLAFMAHINHPAELKTEAVVQAIKNIKAIGVEIRTQSPIMRHINDKACTWRDMWNIQVQLGLIPYYMFIARDTGAQHYFSVPLVKAWQIYKDAYRQVSGIARTVRGPSMSAHPGKIEIVGPATINGEEVLTLNFIQGRNSNWVKQPFFAEYDENATWLNDLKPAFGKKKFFFETELIDDVKLN
ncbi:MAG: lysine 2,3-aminomutase [Bacteroidales bacterium]|nr:lysine 2,3-aminomutase [Bacteroidales bacterium]